MAHYSIEIRGHPPIDWTMLREQRNTLVGLVLGTDERAPRFGPNSEAVAAIDGVVQLLDAMLDTQEGPA